MARRIHCKAQSSVPSNAGQRVRSLFQYYLNFHLGLHPLHRFLDQVNSVSDLSFHLIGLFIGKREMLYYNIVIDHSRRMTSSGRISNTNGNFHPASNFYTAKTFGQGALVSNSFLQNHTKTNLFDISHRRLVGS